MDALDFTREQLAQYILTTAKESSISKIKRIVLSEKKKKEIVAYTVQGEPLTKKKYTKAVKEAEVRLSAGEHTTHEDLLEEMKTW